MVGPLHLIGTEEVALPLSLQRPIASIYIRKMHSAWITAICLVNCNKHLSEDLALIHHFKNITNILSKVEAFIILNIQFILVTFFGSVIDTTSHTAVYLENSYMCKKQLFVLFMYQDLAL